MKRFSILFCLFWAIAMFLFSTGFIIVVANEEIVEENNDKTSQEPFLLKNYVVPLEKEKVDIPLEPLLSIDESKYGEMICEEDEVEEDNSNSVIYSERRDEVENEKSDDSSKSTELIEKSEEAGNSANTDDGEEEFEGEYEVIKTLMAASYNSETEKVEEVVVHKPVTTFKDVPIESMPDNYLEVMWMVSTAYCHCKKCCGKDENHPAYGLTYSGVNLLDGKVHKVIAADIKILPLGTVVYIKDYGIATVADIGGGVNGDRIDIYFPTHDEAWDWDYGMQEIEVYILEYPEK